MARTTARWTGERADRLHAGEIVEWRSVCNRHGPAWARLLFWVSLIIRLYRFKMLSHVPCAVAGGQSMKLEACGRGCFDGRGTECGARAQT